MFNGIWLLATEPLTVQGRTIRAGERFHISRTHSGALLVTGRATILHPQPPRKSKAPDPVPEPPPARRRRRAPKADEAVVETVDPPSSDTSPAPPDDDAEAIDVPRRQYHRRDLEPEP